MCWQDDGSWRCKHGEEECSGDLQQLCVQKFSKPYNRVKWTLGFVLCSNKQGLDATGSFATASRCLQVRFYAQLLQQASWVTGGDGGGCVCIHRGYVTPAAWQTGSAVGRWAPCRRCLRSLTECDGLRASGFAKVGSLQQQAGSGCTWIVSDCVKMLQVRLYAQ
jgi:hypothetical protein